MLTAKVTIQRCTGAGEGGTIQHCTGGWGGGGEGGTIQHCTGGAGKGEPFNIVRGGGGGGNHSTLYGGAGEGGKDCIMKRMRSLRMLLLKCPKIFGHVACLRSELSSERSSNYNAFFLFRSLKTLPT